MCLARLDVRDRPKDRRHEWEQVFERVARCDQNDYPKRGASQILLELKILIGSERYFEADFFSVSQQISILQSRPALSLDSPHVVT